MNELDDFPEDFRSCVTFHGHLCPGLAIGYSAVKAAQKVLQIGSAQDEELVAIVYNDSCAVDAVQVLLGCTFGKGNLVFRDYGKQVFTFMDRNSGRAARISFKGPMPYREERHLLRKKIDSGEASEEDKAQFFNMRLTATMKLVSSDPEEFFEIREVREPLPSKAPLVTTVPCSVCGEDTVRSRMLERDGKLACRECALQE